MFKGLCKCKLLKLLLESQLSMMEESLGDLSASGFVILGKSPYLVPVSSSLGQSCDSLGNAISLLRVPYNNEIVSRQKRKKSYFVPKETEG